MATSNPYANVKSFTPQKLTYEDFTSMGKALGGVATSIGGYLENKENERLTSFTNALEQAKYAGNTEAMKSMLGYSGFTNPENQLKAQGLVRSALDTTQESFAKQALSKANRTGDFTEAEQQAAGINDPIKRQAFLDVLSNAFDTYKRGDLELKASTGDVANAEAMKAQLLSLNIPPAQKAAGIAAIDKQIATIAPREVQQDAMADMEALRSDIDWNQYVNTGLAQSLALDEKTMQNDPRFNQNFEVVNGTLIPRDIESTVRQRLALEGYKGDALNEQLAKEMTPHIKYQQEVQQKLQEYLPETGAKPLDLTARRDANRAALLDKAIKAKLTPEQITLQQAQADMVDAAKFDLGKGAATKLESIVKTNNDKAQAAINELKQTNAVFTKLSDIDFQALKSATSGIKDITGVLNSTAVAGMWTTDYGDKADVAKKLRGLIGKPITFGEGANTQTKKPTEAQIAMAAQLVPLDTWLKPGKDGKGYVDVDILESTLKDVMLRGIGDTEALRIKYGNDAVNAIEQFNKAEQLILNRTAENNLRATNRAYADAKLPSPVSNKTNTNPSSMFGDILGNAAKAMLGIGDAAAASSGIPGNTGSTGNNIKDSDSTNTESKKSTKTTAPLKDYSAGTPATLESQKSNDVNYIKFMREKVAKGGLPPLEKAAKLAELDALLVTAKQNSTPKGFGNNAAIAALTKEIAKLNPNNPKDKVKLDLFNKKIATLQEENKNITDINGLMSAIYEVESKNEDTAVNDKSYASGAGQTMLFTAIDPGGIPDIFATAISLGKKFDDNENKLIRSIKSKIKTGGKGLSIKTSDLDSEEKSLVSNLLQTPEYGRAFSKNHLTYLITKYGGDIEKALLEYRGKDRAGDPRWWAGLDAFLNKGK